MSTSVLALTAALAVALGAGCGSGGSGPAGDADATVAGGDTGFNFPTGIGSRPTVTILSPDPETEVKLGDAVVLAGLVVDDEDSPQSLVVTWSSDLDGLLDAPVPKSNGVVSITVSDLSAGVHRLTLRAIDSDGESGDASVDLTVTGEVGDPLVSISPASPRTADDLSAVVTLPEGAQGAEVSYRWLRDGLDSGLTSSVVPSQLTERGDTWQVKVTVDAGHGQASEGAAQALIGNTAPTCEEALLLPSAGTTSDSFQCLCSSREDDDPADPVEDRCVFLIDDAPVEAGGDDSCALPPGTAARGDFLSCKFIAADGMDEGAAVTAGPTAILNAAPSKPTVTIDPPGGGLGTVFTCGVEGGDDPDGDSVTYQYTWSVEGYDNPGSTSASLTAASLSSDSLGTIPKQGDQLRCEARAFDGSALSGPGVSQTVVLGNSAPSGGAVLVEPGTATEASVLTCVATDATDPDGQPIVWFFGWAVDGQPVLGEASQTLTGEHFDKGDAVTCVATPSDGTENGPSVSSKNQVVVQNTLPALESATVSPAEASTTQVFTCSWAGWLDPDPADAEAIVTLQWEQWLDGAWAPIEGETDATLAAVGFGSGDQVRCVATPWNGAQSGAPAVSEPATVVNSEPTVAAAAIVPGAGGPCLNYACEASGVVDPDGDDTMIAYRWTLNDAPAGENKAVLAGVTLLPGHVLRCFASATDGTFDAAGALKYGPEVGSSPVVITNTAPVIATATLTPAEPLPQSTLKCTPSNLTDVDSCQGGYSWWYTWIVDGEVLDGATGQYLEAATLLPETTVQCTVVPSDGYDFGPPAVSNVVVIQAQEPQVAISAPSGASGAVQCELVQPVQVPGPVTYTYYWSFNGGVEQVLPATLPGESVHDCDTLTCRVVATAPDFEAGSNVASAAFPFGSDCNDGQPCTHDSCAPTGGCVHQIHSEPCEDGEPCTAGENCAGGICGGGLPVSCDDSNACTADECLDGVGCQHADVEGPCGSGGICIDGVCCEPSCQGKDCGGDGCGGSCGQCEDPAICDTELGQCIGPSPGMTIISLGAFWMGCNQNDDLACKNDEYPFHLVYVQPFEIDLFETTVDEFAECVDGFQCTPPGTGPLCNYLYADRGDHPVNCVNWYDAQTFCQWSDKRLCTEAEWEMAARGIDARRYPWGFALPDCSLAIGPDAQGADGCGTGGTSAVGSLPAGASPYGLHDMAGNVHEWVLDWYSEVTYAGSNEDPVGPASGNLKVRRGGAYNSDPGDMRTSARHKSSPLFGAPEHGVRCCKDFP